MPALQPIMMDGEEYICLTHFAVQAGINDAQYGGHGVETFRVLLEKNKIPIVKIKKAGWVKEREFVSMSNLEYAKRCVEKHCNKSDKHHGVGDSISEKMELIVRRIETIENKMQSIFNDLYGKTN
jgi:hypothetical protein